MSEANPVPQPENDPALPQPRKRRWLKRLTIAVGGLVLLLILLVALLPALLGTAPVRRMVLSQLNDRVNGTIAVRDWSVGWNSGIALEGLSITDPQGQVILSAQRVYTPLSLLGAARGNYDLGETVIQSPVVHLVVDESGRVNLASIWKSQAPAAQTPPKPTSESGGLPRVRGSLKIADLTGTVVAAGVPQTLHIQDGDLAFTIPGLDQTISEDIQLVLAVGERPPGTVALVGSADLFPGGKFVPEKLAARQALKIDGLQAAALAPFLKMAGVDLRPDGLLHVALDANLVGPNDLSAKGNIEVNQFALTGAALNGDALRSASLSIPIDLSRASVDGQAWVKGDVAVKLQQGAVALRIDAPQDAVPEAADLIARAIQGALGTASPSARSVHAGGSGSVALSADLDAADLLNQLSHTVKLAQGTTLEQGHLTHRTTVGFSDERAAVASHTLLENVRGQIQGKAGQLQPIELMVALIAAGGDQPDVKDIKLRLGSGFAAIDGGGASLRQLNVQGTVDLAKAQAELGQFVAIDQSILAALGAVRGEAVAPAGDDNARMSGQVKFALDSSGDAAKPGEPLRVRGRLEADALAVTGVEARAQVNLPLLVTTVDLPLERAGDGGASTIRNGALTVMAGTEESRSLDVSARGDVNLTTMSVPSFALERLRVDLALAQRQFGSLIPALERAGLRFAGGQFIAGAQGAWEDELLSLAALDVQPTQVHLSRTVDGRNEPMLSGLTAKLSAAGAVNLRQGTDIRLSALRLTESTGALDLRKSDERELMMSLPGNGALRAEGTLTLSSDLSKLDQLLQPFMAAPAEGSVPLQITGGSVEATVSVGHQPGATQVTIPQLRGRNIAFRRGGATYTAQPIDLALEAALASAGGELRQVNVTRLAGNLGVVTVSMPEPIAIGGLGSERLTASGAIRVEGQIEPVAKLVDALQGTPAGEALPYSGAFVVVQRLATQGNDLAAKGQVNITDLVVMRDGKPAFSEKALRIDNDLVLDAAAKNLGINGLSIDMPSSQALQLALSGRVLDYDSRRQFQNVRADLAYDLLKLFDLARPLLSDSLRQKLADAKMWGQYRRQFVINGSLPADKPFHEAIRLLQADGGIAVGGFDGMGITLANLDVPVKLADGKLSIAGGTQRPAPATLNGGKLDLNGAVIDLTGEHARLTLPPNHVVLSNVGLNPVLANQAMGSFNPLFVNPQRAGGLVDVVAERVENVPLDDLLLQRGANAGTAQLKLSVRQFAIENPFTQAVGAFLDKKGGGGAMFHGSIDNAQLDVSGGVLSQDLALEIGGFALRFSGKVSLADQRLMPLNITIPAAQLASVDKNLVKYLPEGITIPITGTTTHFNIAIDQVLPKLLADAATRALLDRGLGGNRDKPKDGAPREAPKDPLENLLDQLQRRDKPEKPPERNRR